jgi:hypothetical protein
MATTFALRPISPVIRNESYRYVTPPLAAAQDFKKGAPALLNVTGTVQEGGTNPADILGFFTAASGQYDWKEDTLGKVVPAVPVALATGVFRGTLKGTFAAADVGEDFGITEDASGYWVVDRAKSGSNQRVLVIGVDDEVEVGDIDVPCTFTVLPANRQILHCCFGAV